LEQVSGRGEKILGSTQTYSRQGAKPRRSQKTRGSSTSRSLRLGALTRDCFGFFTPSWRFPIAAEPKAVSSCVNRFLDTRESITAACFQQLLGISRYRRVFCVSVVQRSAARQIVSRCAVAIVHRYERTAALYFQQLLGISRYRRVLCASVVHGSTVRLALQKLAFQRRTMGRSVECGSLLPLCSQPACWHRCRPRASPRPRKRQQAAALHIAGATVTFSSFRYHGPAMRPPETLQLGASARDDFFAASEPSPGVSPTPETALLRLAGCGTRRHFKSPITRFAPFSLAPGSKMSLHCAGFAENVRIISGHFVQVFFVFIHIPASNAQINIFFAMPSCE
jgi:hypothetical protein